VITKILVAAAVAAAAVGVAAPAGADPSPFNVLSCDCSPTVSKGGPPATDQMELGIQTGLIDLQDLPGPQ
jgi:hypothetical protein